MKFDEAKDKFIQSWGVLGKNWGINRTMAQVQALLLISPEPLTTEEVMEELSISRGNANMNIRMLIDWGLAKKVVKAGERKEYFYSEKDIWDLAKQVVKERRKREIEPLLEVLNEIDQIEGNDEKVETLKQVTGDFKEFAQKLNDMADKALKSDEHWFYGLIIKMLK